MKKYNKKRGKDLYRKMRNPKVVEKMARIKRAKEFEREILLRQKEKQKQTAEFNADLSKFAGSN